METPRLEIRLNKIRHNAETIVGMCRSQGIDVVGVTKGVSGIPQVGKAMLKGGVCGLADARIRNVRKLRQAGIVSPIMMLRLPKLSSAASVVSNTNVSLNSELSMIRSLARECRKLHCTHGVILMIDVGDLREGVMHTRALEWMEKILSLDGVDLRGIGTNVGCYGGVLPNEENMGLLADIAKESREKLSFPLPVVSIGGTNCLDMVRKLKMPREINQIRVGEGILLGRDSSRHAVLDGTFQDTFELVAEIVEIKQKPSMPFGTLGRDAFGNRPVFKDHGVRRRALIALGKQDVRLPGLIPVDDRIKILGGSSDYIVLDISDSERGYLVGDQIAFHLLYPAMLSVTTSPYVHICFKDDENECDCEQN